METRKIVFLGLFAVSAIMSSHAIAAQNNTQNQETQWDQSQIARGDERGGENFDRGNYNHENYNHGNYNNQNYNHGNYNNGANGVDLYYNPAVPVNVAPQPYYYQNQNQTYPNTNQSQ